MRQPRNSKSLSEACKCGDIEFVEKYVEAGKSL